MTDLFNDPQMAAYINPLKNIKAQYLVRARLDNSLPNGGLKLVPRSDAVCARTALKRTVWYSSPITGPNNKLSGSTSCRTDNSIYISSFIRFTLINTLGKHVTSVEKSAMTDKQNKNPPQSISTLMVTKVVIIDHDLALDEHGEEQHREVPVALTKLFKPD